MMVITPDAWITRTALSPPISPCSPICQDAGYEVGLLGKAHVKDLGKRRWDYYFGYPGAATDYFWPVITEGSKGVLGQPRSTTDMWKMIIDGPFSG